MFTLFTDRSFAIQDHEEVYLTASLKCVQKLIELKELDQELKSTWSYQGCVLAKAFYEVVKQGEPLTYWGYTKSLISTVTQHYAPQIFYNIGSLFILTRLQKPYETAVSYGFGTAHAYSIYCDPLKQALGYCAGFFGAYLARGTHKEMQGVLYFYFREAGYTASDYSCTLYDDLLLSYERFTASPCLIDPSFLEEKAVEVGKMDDNIIIKTPLNQTTSVLIPLCDDDSLRQKAVLQFNAKVVPNLLKAYLQAQTENMKLDIIFGTVHSSCGCYWQERELLKWVKSLGINHALFEVSDSRLNSSLRDIENLKSFNATSYDLLEPSSSTNGRFDLVAKITHAQKLNFTLIAGDPWTEKESPVWETEVYFQVLRGIISGKYTRNMNFTTTDGFPLRLNQCPRFSDREREMVSAKIQVNDSFVEIVGACHLGNLEKRLRKINNKSAILFLASCWEFRGQTTLHDLITPYIFKRFFGKINIKEDQNQKASLFDQVFGKGCGASYLKYKEGMFYAINPSEVVQCGLDPYYDILYEHDIGSYKNS